MESPIKEVISKAPSDHGTCFQDLGHVFSPDHHVSVVELDVNIRLLVYQVIGSSGRGQADQFPEVTAQLMATGSLHFRKRGGEKGERGEDKKLTLLRILIYVKIFGNLVLLRPHQY